MALTLLTAITANETVFDVLGSDDLETGDFKTIDSETIVIRRAQVSTLAYGQSARQRLSVYRGSGGTRAAAHAANASLATYTGGGSGGVTVTDGTTTVDPVTSVQVPNVVDGGGGLAVLGPISGSPAALYYSDTDPGAVGTGAIWLRIDEDNGLTSFFIRNPDNDGWICPSLVLYGPDGLNPTPTAWVQLADFGTPEVDLTVQALDQSLLAKLKIGGAEGYWIDPARRLPDLPTSDPGVGSKLWNDNGTVKITAAS